MTSDPIRVLCVDDHAFLAAGLEARLGVEPDIEYVGWSATAADLPDAAVRTGATVVLLDIDMPGSDSFDALREMRRVLPEVAVLILSGHVRERYLQESIRAGAQGYHAKTDDPTSLVEGIRSVSNGMVSFGPSIRQQYPEAAAGAANGDGATTRLDRLTPRETQVLRMIASGLSRQDIAQAIHRSPKTIDNHRASIMEKLDIHDRVELARYAIREGLADA